MERIFWRLEGYAGQLSMLPSSGSAEPYYLRKYGGKLRRMPLPDHWKEKQADELKHYVLRRGVQETCTEEDREALCRFVDRIIVHSGAELEFHLNCGLVLLESSAIGNACSVGQPA